MDILEKLQNAGLTGNEAKVYLELLKRGESLANRIAKNLGMDRTLVYTLLNSLIEKGQASYVVKKNKKVFLCSNPDNLLNSVKAKEYLVSELIVDLKKLKKEETEETEVRVYEGNEAIRLLIREAMKFGTFDSFGSTGRAYDLLFEAPAAFKESYRLRLSCRLIVGSRFKSHEFVHKYPNLKIKFLDVDSEATTTIMGDRVFIHLIKDKPVLLIIKNKHIAKSYQNYFNYLWSKASS